MKVKRVVPGIHNYCDRWCERCPLTTRCAIFEQAKCNEEETEGLEGISNTAFWKRLTKNFERAMSLINNAAVSYGVDINNISDEELARIHAQQEQVRVESDRHPLTVLSLEYAQASLQTSREARIMDKVDQVLHSKIMMGLVSEDDAEEQLLKVENTLSVIEWYVHFIPPKLSRAISGKLEDDGWEALNGFQKDADGSAKIALIAIERSMEAWVHLYDLVPEIEDESLAALAMLEKMKKLTRCEFPDAEKFVRPGFDDAK